MKLLLLVSEKICYSEKKMCRKLLLLICYNERNWKKNLLRKNLRKLMIIVDEFCFEVEGRRRMSNLTLIDQES